MKKNKKRDLSRHSDNSGKMQMRIGSDNRVQYVYAISSAEDKNSTTESSHRKIDADLFAKAIFD